MAEKTCVYSLNLRFWYEFFNLITNAELEQIKPFQWNTQTHTKNIITENTVLNGNNFDTKLPPRH